MTISRFSRYRLTIMGSLFRLLPALAALAIVSFPACVLGQGIFDTLQTNAWYLPTAHKKANLYVTSLGRARW